MLKEILLLSSALIVISVAQQQQQQQPQNYILTNTQSPQVQGLQWAWNSRQQGQQPGQGGYWAWGPNGWQWVNPWANRPWWGWNNNFYSNYPNYWTTTQYPGK